MNNIVSFSDIVNLVISGATVVTDSRKVGGLVKSGEKVVYIALRGDRFDGNDFVEQTLKDGASVVVCDRLSFSPTSRVMVVDDSLLALQSIATLYRKALKCKVIAVTGSNGKTTTKELLFTALSAKFECQATVGNLNNHIGVPLTVLSIRPATQYAIVEMGANHQKEIELLCSIAQPNYGIITNIGRAHLEGFGGVEGIIAGKGELFDYLNSVNGIAFYLTDSKELTSMVAERKNLNVVPYNRSFISTVSSGMEFAQLRCNNIDFKTYLIGDYNLLNISAAFTIARYFGINDNTIAQAIEGYIPKNMRSQCVTTSNNRVIVDGYNANPSSMKGAIDTLLSKSDKDKKLFILGDMKELGPYALEEHKAVAKRVSESGYPSILIGECFYECGDYPNCTKLPSIQNAYTHLQNIKPKGYDILLKGSRSIGVERLLELL